MKDKARFILQQAETEAIFKFGSEWPVQVVATVYEENGLGEKRLVDQKTFKLVEG